MEHRKLLGRCPVCKHWFSVTQVAAPPHSGYAPHDEEYYEMVAHYAPDVSQYVHQPWLDTTGPCSGRNKTPVSLEMMTDTGHNHPRHIGPEHSHHADAMAFS